MKAGRIVMIVIGALLALIGFGWRRQGRRPRRLRHATRRRRVLPDPGGPPGPPTYAIVSDRIDLEHQPGAVRLVDRPRRLGTVKLALDPAEPDSRSSPASAERDVAAYLDGVSQDQIRDVEVSPNRVRYRRMAGEAVPARSGRADVLGRADHHGHDRPDLEGRERRLDGRRDERGRQSRRRRRRPPRDQGGLVAAGRHRPARARARPAGGRHRARHRRRPGPGPGRGAAADPAPDRPRRRRPGSRGSGRRSVASLAARGGAPARPYPFV